MILIVIVIMCNGREGVANNLTSDRDEGWVTRAVELGGIRAYTDDGSHM